MALVIYPSGVPIESGSFSVSADSFSVCQMTSTKFFMVYRQYSPNYIFGRVLDVNETSKTISYGDQWVINIAGPQYRSLVVRRVDDNKAALFINDHNTGKLEGMTVQISGLIPVFSSSYTLLSASTIWSYLSPMQIVELGVSSFYALYHHINNNSMTSYKITVSGNSFDVIYVPSSYFTTSYEPIIMPHKLPTSSNIIPYITKPYSDITFVSGFYMTISRLVLDNFYVATSSVNTSASTFDLTPNVYVSASNYSNNYIHISAFEPRMDVSKDGSTGAVFFGNKIIIFKLTGPNANQVAGVDHNFSYAPHPNEVLMDIAFIRNDEILAVTNSKAQIFKLVGTFPNYGIIKTSSYTFFNSPSDVLRNYSRFYYTQEKQSTSVYKRLFRISENMYIYFFRETQSDPTRAQIRTVLFYAP